VTHAVALRKIKELQLLLRVEGTQMILRKTDS
jgi:hypothetical protein